MPAYATISETNWIFEVAAYVKFSTEVQNEIFCVLRVAACSWADFVRTEQHPEPVVREWRQPPGVLTGGNNSMLVKPLFTSSQGHAIWDDNLIINWDLAGYHGEAFGTQSRPKMWIISSHEFGVGLCLVTQDALWALTSQQNLLFTEKNSLLGAICTSKSLSFFFPQLCEKYSISSACQDIKNHRSSGTWELKIFVLSCLCH